eukprot:TRINITY_DN28143_c0_g1_i1.p1 TRINITY_DN28143_c0_g1~~TRINITY_DN28143_c0_g1_i1.p1  ORF type:complete len:354 (-),score=86.71 TRINITY_DN28143_c0_g1_i1:57-1118(-)
MSYLYMDKVDQHIRETQQKYPNLRPVNESFTSNDGRTRTLTHLVGTIPITIRGNVYHIPVKIVLLEEYPLKAPRAWVTPTVGMAIRPQHQHVDMNGIVYLPYLNQWNNRYRLVVLCENMSTAFSALSPVYAKPAQQQQPPPRAQPQQPAYAAATYGSPQYGGQRQDNIPYNQLRDLTPEEKQRARESAQQEKKKVFDNKVKRATTEKIKEIQASMDKYLVEQTTLSDEEARIQARVTMLRKAEEDIDALIAQATEEETTLQSQVADGSGKPIATTDDVYSPDLHGDQLIEMVAEDAAYEDTLYKLSRWLLQEKVQLEDFLKDVRDLSRKQFFCRALINKLLRLRETAGSRVIS